MVSLFQKAKKKANILDVVEDGDVQVGLAALSRGHTTDELGAVLNGLLRVEGTLYKINQNQYLP